jgi:hypothetical protein
MFHWALHADAKGADKYLISRLQEGGRKVALFLTLKNEKKNASRRTRISYIKYIEAMLIGSVTSCAGSVF